MKRILHVTEALGGGVVHSLSQLAIAQASSNFDVFIAHSIRKVSPSEELLESLFPAPISRIVVPMVTQISPWNDMVSTFKLMKLFVRLKPDVIHLHSSKCGVLGRVAARLLGWQGKVFYSPRGFAFLREDVSPLKRSVYLGLEKICVPLGGVLVGCSESEAQLARDEVRHKRVVLVENSVVLEQITQSAGGDGVKIRVVTSGLLKYQKAPWRFRDMCLQLADEPASFVWVGDGELRKELLVDGALPGNMEVSGWRDRRGVLDELHASDIFVLTSLYEGMPMSLIEAQVAGLPAVVTNVVGSRDVVINGVTGFVCDSMEEVIKKIRLLIRDDRLRKKMGCDAREAALKRFNVERMHHNMLETYRLRR